VAIGGSGGGGGDGGTVSVNNSEDITRRAPIPTESSPRAWRRRRHGGFSVADIAGS
jgi:hypothetical protein